MVTKKKKDELVQSLHPTTIFHFTDKEDAFYSILSQQYFRPSLSTERITGVEGRRYFSVPMVSFCDIKLSQILYHSIKYGEFGFGLTKSWAEKNALHPVLYMSQASTLFSKYNARIRLLKDKLIPLWSQRFSLVGKERDVFDNLKSEYADLYNLLRYMKNYKGTLKRRGKKDVPNFMFADEKEWRYVPEPFVGDFWPSLNFEKVKQRNDARLMSEKFANYGVRFTFEDIKYIIIPTEKHINKLIEHISELDNYNPSIISKIITMEKVRNDF
ncbi:hypothetical protein AZZ62_005151 [Klebsiella variicola]|nr:hypothetical protein AZZ62_005151 [Klebsiella variicola]